MIRNFFFVNMQELFNGKIILVAEVSLQYIYIYMESVYPMTSNVLQIVTKKMLIKQKRECMLNIIIKLFD